MGMAGKIAEIRAWREWSRADADAVRVYIAQRWEMLTPENQRWLFDKVMEEAND